MYLQKRNYNILLVITIVAAVTFIATSVVLYIINCFWISIISQLALSIFTGAILAVLIAYISYRHARLVFVNTVACEMRLLFDDIDEYLKVISGQRNYIETYYNFRCKFLSIQSVLFSEVLLENDIKVNSIIREYGEAFGAIRLLLYHSYFSIKTLDLTRNNDSNFIKVKQSIPDQIVKAQLDETLRPLHEKLQELAHTDSLNRWAKELREIVGISFSVNMEEKDALYQKTFTGNKESMSNDNAQ